MVALPTADRRRETTIADDELLLAVELPQLPAGSLSTYVKAMDRKVWAFALVGVAAVLQIDGGNVVDARLVLSGVAPIPWRVAAAEQALIGQAVTDLPFGQIADLALQGAEPLRHNRYKLPFVRSLVLNALTSLVRT